VHRCAVVIKLQGHADDVIALLFQQGRYDRGIDASGHRDDDPYLGGRFGETKIHGLSFSSAGSRSR